MSEKILTSPNGQRVSVDLETGDVKPLPRIPVTAGASGGRSAGGLSLGPGSVDPEPNDEPQYGNATDVSRVAADVAEPFKAAGRSVLRANNTAANAIVHPVDTAEAVAANPKAYAREALRGVNSNIPGANTAVEAIGGPPAESPEDQSAAPGVSDLTGLAAAPLVGGVIGDVAGAVARPIGEAAKARLTKSLPTAITGGATSKAAKGVIGARDILQETAKAHPDLQAAILSGDDATKHAAISGKLDALTAANDEATNAIATDHPRAVGGRVPTDSLYFKLQDFAQKAHEAGDESLLDATSKAIDSIQKFESAGTISPSQLRGVRNGLAKKIAGQAPLSTVARETGAVKGVINEAISGLAEETPTVDAGALKERNRHIASLLPAQQFLEQKAETEAGKVPGRLAEVARAVSHPAATAAHLAERIPSVIDTHLAKLAGNSGPAGVAALKAVALSPSRQTLQAAIQAGVAPQVALQVARLGAQQAGVQ